MTLDVSDGLARAIAVTSGTALMGVLLDDDFLTVVLVTGMEGMEDAIRRFLKSVTEGVVMSFVVVVTHLVVFFADFDVEVVVVVACAEFSFSNVDLGLSTINVNVYVAVGMSVVMTSVIRVVTIDLNVQSLVGVTVTVTVVRITLDFDV